MKIKEGLILRQIADTYVVVAVGEAAKNFKGMVTLNSTGGFLWKKLSEGTDESGLVDSLMSEYDVDRKTAEKDVAKFIENVRNANFLE